VDTTEARALLAKEVAGLRKLPYEEFASRFPPIRKRYRLLGFTLDLVGDGRETEHHELHGPSGAWYQVETLVAWDGEEGGDIRVMVSIDDGGSSAYRPMTDDFIIAPDGSFIGE
jgi:hypothetical protein